MSGSWCFRSDRSSYLPLGLLNEPTAQLIHYLLGKSITDRNKMQELHIPVGRKIVLHRPSFIFPVSPCQPFYFPMLCYKHFFCFSPVHSPCPQSTSQSLSKFYSLSPAQPSGVSPSTLLFWSNPKLFQVLIQYLLSPTRALRLFFIHVACQFTAACHSTSPEVQSFCPTRFTRFLHWPHCVL